MKRDIIQAMADPIRRAMIALVALHTRTPNALGKHFDLSRQLVSKHLRILTESALVSSYSQDSEIYHSLEIE